MAATAEAAELLASLVGLEETEVSAEEATEVARGLVEALADERPLVLVVEDIHWAEPALLDLLDELADLVRDVPVLLLCLARPELLDAGRRGAAASTTPSPSCSSRFRRSRRRR